MTLRSSDLQPDGDLDSIRNSCDVFYNNCQLLSISSLIQAEDCSDWIDCVTTCLPVIDRDAHNIEGGFLFLCKLKEAENDDELIGTIDPLKKTMRMRQLLYEVDQENDPTMCDDEWDGSNAE